MFILEQPLLPIFAGKPPVESASWSGLAKIGLPVPEDMWYTLASPATGESPGQEIGAGHCE